jgi:hypothetical protein
LSAVQFDGVSSSSPLSFQLETGLFWTVVTEDEHYHPHYPLSLIVHPVFFVVGFRGPNVQMKKW